jgi:nucleotide-binding universal stress UspA family protein
MLNTKKILCPVDFSEPSYEALKRAGESALHFSAELIAIHVIHTMQTIRTPGDPAYFRSYERDMEAATARKLSAAVRAMVPEGVKSRCIVVHGNPADRIVETAAREGADVIFIATHGMTGWRHYISDSVAKKVARCAPCAVMTIKASGKKRDATRVAAS